MRSVNESKRISERRIRNNRIRRVRQLRRNLLMSLLTVLLISGFSLGFFSFRTKAQSNHEEVYYKYYKSIEIQTGDSLWDYAAEYGKSGEAYQKYIDEVIEINHLPDEEIVSGQYIVLPYYSIAFVQ